MTDEDMFETMDRILGDITPKEVGASTRTYEAYPSGPSGDRKDWMENKSYNSGVSKPSHPLWKLIDQWGGQIYLSADQLELWEGEP